LYQDDNSIETTDLDAALAWIGPLTPALSHFIKSLKRHTSDAVFNQRMSTLVYIFKKVKAELLQLNPGIDRAIYVLEKVTKELDPRLMKNSKCGQRCSACCHKEKEITSDEAELLASLIEHGQDFDLDLMIRQSETPRKGNNDIDTKCPFLKSDDNCGIYEFRPAVCRKLFVKSAPEICKEPKGDVEAIFHFMPEIIVSVACDLADNPKGPLSKMIIDKILQRKLDEDVTTSVES